MYHEQATLWTTELHQPFDLRSGFQQIARVMKLCQWHIILTLTFLWHFLNAHFVPWTQIGSIKVTYLKIMEGSISNMLEEGSNNRGISLFKLVKGLLLLLTYKTSHDVSWKTYEADVKDQSILFNHQAQCHLRSSVGTISLLNILIPTETTWND